MFPSDRLSELTAGLVGPPGPPGRGRIGKSGKPGPRGPIGANLLFKHEGGVWGGLIVLSSASVLLPSFSFYLWHAGTV